MAEDATTRDAAPPPSPPPPRGPHWSTLLGLLALAIVAYAVGAAWGGKIGGVVGGLLRSVSPGHEHGGDEVTEDAPAYYTCGMHPWVILPKPGLCPVCHMDLTPLDPAKFTGEITIDPVLVQNMGVRVEEVVTGPLVRTIRTLGSIEYDETRVRDVNIKVKGWIEKLHVNYLGAEVKAGDPLFELYSPELYDTQQQYLLAYKNRGEKPIEFFPGAGGDPARMLESSRVRLEFFDITPEGIRALEQRGEPQKTMTIVSPHTGVVIAKHANEGMLVEPGMQVFRIADVSKVWVLATLYEYQLPYIAVGQRAVMTLSYIPGQTFEGTVVYVYPYLERKTREVQVRLELDNPSLLLKPGMFANVELKSVLARERTLVSSSAVIDTGERQVAFVSLGEGRFEPRDVKTGVLTEGDILEVLDGLRPGELVVTSGQFLIDSEAKLRDALSKMIRGERASEQSGPALVAGVSELSSLPETATRAIGRILDAYLTIGGQLASDTIDGIPASARSVAEGVDALLAESLEDPHFWHRHTEAATIRGEALKLVGVTRLDDARLAYAELSLALSKLLKATGIPPTLGKSVEELHCPMYREGQGGGTWLQADSEVRNPFFGATMLRCFDLRMALPPTRGPQSAPDMPATGGGKSAPASGAPGADEPAGGADS